MPQGLIRKTEPWWVMQGKRFILRIRPPTVVTADSTVLVKPLLLHLMPGLKSAVQAIRKRKQTWSGGEQRQTGTREDELGHTSASNLNNAGNIGAFYHGLACVSWPRFRAADGRDLIQVEEATGTVAAPCQQGKPTDHELWQCLVIQHWPSKSGMNFSHGQP